MLGLWVPYAIAYTISCQVSLSDVLRFVNLAVGFARRFSCLVKSHGQLALVTWNCATLLGALPRSSVQRERHVHKIDFAARLALGNDAVLSQEVHGGAGGLVELAHRLPRHTVMGSFSVPRMLLGALQFWSILDSWGSTLAGFLRRCWSLVGLCALL